MHTIRWLSTALLLLGTTVASAGTIMLNHKKPNVSQRTALLVGIDQYQSKQMPQLKGAANDVLVMKQVLEDHGFKVRVLLNTNATKKAIMTALSNHLKRGSNKVDHFVFHYSGHGIDTYLHPYDSGGFSDQSSAISLLELKKLYGRAKMSLGDQHVAIIDTTSAWRFGSLLEGQGTVLAANSGAGQSVMEINKPRMGLFTNVLAQALYKAGWRKWEWRQLFTFVKTLMQKHTKVQIPAFYGYPYAEVFGGQWVPQSPRLVVNPATRGSEKLTVRAGTFRGIEVGAKLAVFKEVDDVSPQGYATVTSVGLVESVCTIDRKQNWVSYILRKGGFASLVSGHVKPTVIRLQSSFTAVNDAVKSMSFVRIVGTKKGSYDYRILESQAEGKYLIQTGPGVFMPELLDSAGIKALLQSAFLKGALKKLDNPDPLKSINVELFVHRVDDLTDQDGKRVIDRDYGHILDTKARTPRIRSGTTVQFRVVNNSKTKAWFTIVRAGGAAADIVYPAKDEEGHNVIGPGQTMRLARTVVLDKTGPQVLKLIATSKPGQDFRGVDKIGRRLLSNLVSFAVKRENKSVALDYEAGLNWGTAEYEFSVYSKGAQKPGKSQTVAGDSNSGPIYSPDPVVRVTFPKIGAAGKAIINESKVRIRGALPIGARVLKLTVNEAEIRPRPDNTFMFPAALAWGTNKFTFVATGMKGQKFTKDFKVERPQIKRDGKDYAVFIALQNYSGRGWTKLNNPVADAKALQQLLVNEYGFVSDAKDLLINPTKGNIINKLRQLAGREFGDDDQVLLFLTGHGALDTTTGLGYTAMLNAKSGDPEYKGYMSHSELEGYFGAIKAKHKLVILDVCHGGSFDRSKVELMKSGNDMTMPKAEYIRHKLKMPSAEFLASAQLDKVSDGEPGQHSPFAKALLKAFSNSLRKYGILTFSQLYSEVGSVKPGPHGGDLYKTRGEFLFIRQ